LNKIQRVFKPLDWNDSVYKLPKQADFLHRQH
jgi:hypothetical protein